VSLPKRAEAKSLPVPYLVANNHLAARFTRGRILTISLVLVRVVILRTARFFRSIQHEATYKENGKIDKRPVLILRVTHLLLPIYDTRCGKLRTALYRSGEVTVYHEE
jgi:hypothetical protein